MAIGESGERAAISLLEHTLLMPNPPLVVAGACRIKILRYPLYGGKNVIVGSINQRVRSGRPLHYEDRFASRAACIT